MLQDFFCGSMKDDRGVWEPSSTQGGFKGLQMGQEAAEGDPGLMKVETSP